MKRIAIFLFLLSSVFIAVIKPDLAYAQTRLKTGGITDIIKNLPSTAQCIAGCPLFDFNCYSNCVQNILPNPVPSVPPPNSGSNDIIQCATSCLSNPNPASCLTNCAPNLPSCALSCGVPPDLNCVINQCQQNNTSPSNGNQQPPPENIQPPVSSPVPQQTLSQCRREGGYCTQNRLCDDGYEYKGFAKECPGKSNGTEGICCELVSSSGNPPSAPDSPLPPGVDPYLPAPAGPSNGTGNPPDISYVNCNGNYTVTVQGCKLVFCEWRTVSGNETLCVKPEQCNISVCNQYLAGYGPQIAEREAAKEGAYIKPGTFSGSCNSVTSLGTACSNPSLGTQSFKLRSREDWQFLMAKISKEEVSPLVVSELIKEVRENGAYYPGLQIITIDLKNPRL